MQALSKAKVGENYTIQWLFGLPEVVEFLHRHHVDCISYSVIRPPGYTKHTPR